MITEEFTGCAPAVGEVRAIRTFRVGTGGRLCSLSSEHAWPDGTMTAQCPIGDHDPAAAECTCGLYAFASAEIARQDPHAAHVLAVVACWGRIVAGTRGLRGQHARIEAIWLSGAVPEQLVGEVTAR